MKKKRRWTGQGTRRMHQQDTTHRSDRKQVHIQDKLNPTQRERERERERERARAPESEREERASERARFTDERTDGRTSHTRMSNDYNKS